MQTILIILGIYLLYKFMVDFVIPVYKTTKRVQQQFKNMQQRGNPDGAAAPRSFDSSTQQSSSFNGTKVSQKDYIDFEEVKD